MTLLRLPEGTLDIDASLLELDRADCRESLAAFVRMGWHILEPGQPYVHGWHIDALCAHLEAITDGVEIMGKPFNRLLANVPPGMMKSLLITVFWPAWEWGPMNMPHLRYICVSHSQDNAIRDNVKCRRLISSDWYQERWPHVRMARDQNAKLNFENTSGGFRQAVAAGGVTGKRGDRVLIDDPHSVESSESDAMRKTTVDWFLEAIPTRLNNPISSVIVVIMQRLHEEDVSGIILDRGLGYVHVMLPMEFEADRRCHTPIMWWPEWEDDPVPFVDFREEGELLFHERFPRDVVERDKKPLGVYAVAGQFQQRPEPRGGGIIPRETWKPWEHETYPPMDFIIASLDTAYTEKEENDDSALTVWGVFTGDTMAQATNVVGLHGRAMAVERTYADGSPKAMLMSAWSEKLELHKLVKKVAETCTKMKVDQLLIENKASGISVAQELRRLFGHESWSVMLVDPRGQDKLARLYSVQHLFFEEMIYAPDRSWADKVITQVAGFPTLKLKDLVDTTSQALRHLRSLGLLTRAPERLAELDDARQHQGAEPAPLYPV